MATKAAKRVGAARGPRAWWVALGVGAMVAVLIALATARVGRPAGVQGPTVGRAAPVEAVEDIQGWRVALAGKPTVLLFMAAWCSRCSYGE